MSYIPMQVLWHVQDWIIFFPFYICCVIYWWLSDLLAHAPLLLKIAINVRWARRACRSSCHSGIRLHNFTLLWQVTKYLSFTTSRTINFEEPLHVPKKVLHLRTVYMPMALDQMPNVWISFFTCSLMFPDEKSLAVYSIHFLVTFLLKVVPCHLPSDDNVFISA